MVKVAAMLSELIQKYYILKPSYEKLILKSKVLRQNIV